jgi:cell filamentation protein
MDKELGGDLYQFSPTDLIDPVIDEAGQVVRSVDWPATDEAGFAKGMAETYGWLNYAHPFREGNGRAGKVFLQHVAEQSPWQLNFGALDVPAEPDAPSMKDLWNLTSALTIAQADATGPNAKVMEAVFQNLTEPRATPVERQETVVTASGLDAARFVPGARRDAAYPAPAAAAVTSTPDSTSDLARPRSTPTSYTIDQTLDRDSGHGL